MVLRDLHRFRFQRSVPHRCYNSATFGFRSFALLFCFQRFAFLELLAFSACGYLFCFIPFSEFSGFERSLLLSGFSAFVLLGGDRVLDTVVGEKRGREFVEEAVE
jgi:hypothetical protein